MNLINSLLIQWQLELGQEKAVGGPRRPIGVSRRAAGRLLDRSDRFERLIGAVVPHRALLGGGAARFARVECARGLAGPWGRDLVHGLGAAAGGFVEFGRVELAVAVGEGLAPVFRTLLQLLKKPSPIEPFRIPWPATVKPLHLPPSRMHP